MANWTIIYVDAGQHRQLRDQECVSRETAFRQARAYLRQGSDVLRIIGPSGEVILLDDIDVQPRDGFTHSRIRRCIMLHGMSADRERPLYANDHFLSIADTPIADVQMLLEPLGRDGPLWVESGHSHFGNRAPHPKTRTVARRLVLFGPDRVSLDALGCDPI